MDDREAMRQALDCAHAVEGRTSPRPPVGAVVVRDNVVVGKGATSPPYGPHAEVHALREAGELARGADLYVTLEPCCVTIHTPPCTQAIIEAGIRRVIMATCDPNPRVCELGIAQLRSAGIEVVVGIEEEEARAIVRPFSTFITRNRPYVTAKWAMTLDGKLAARTGDSYWISGPQARIWVHNLRDRVDAIMVGAGTVRSDDPMLNVRLSAEQQAYARAPRQGPARVVFSTNGDLPINSKLLQPELAAGTYVFVGESCSAERRQRLQACGVELIVLPENAQRELDLQTVLQDLAQRGLMHVLLEGGNRLLGSAFDQGLIDHVAAFIAPKLIGGAAAYTPVGGQGLAAMRDARILEHVHTQIIEGDVLIEGDLPERDDATS
ncbi:bifunctional diaminohydroxyphosphoribosylaminopyrimidine deaminase/5-amino-6-(5-phosphoribosylamino)uracil reductase RibD [Ktedonosporobacter rubrisoli]|uniref:Riboflavin biosynthesis protein RibD n=1 Tax=Ktedonosporobacter rubrisoli TaxID=2509675 RepID=A0A4P6JI09_KTERU|nr:bifunctional diaminohydroxyphosphoribosylaminopyrimidine deaminase/5-amino-6-(5-phosphoribosylamino)uracil reductase RibD [Ktedonosporobacter rubrisoli]QBD74542.1 bifunctional diaminohydroxyphosphoribosylaminopyrimidine deaminase/5-amino-6-(5-phosphoribosylamino)uracil reductase RibD [Ktedonosporobacter rubrisoli]